MADLDLTPGQPKGSETILSEEMWEKVLMNLTDPSDVLNAGKTCTQFQRILHSKTIEAYLAKTLPFLMNYMDGKSVLNCRKVSKGWRDVVDNFFENYFLRRTILGPPKRLKPFRAAEYYGSLCPFGAGYWRDRDYERFIIEMKDHPRNPFVGRAVYFGLYGGRGEEERQEFQNVYNFFEIFGKHMWTLQLYIFERFQLEVEEQIFRFIIRDVFELAPNLKNLYIKSLPLLTVSMSRNEIRAVRALAPAQGLQKLEISDAFMDYRDHEVQGIEVEKAILLRHANSQLSVLHTRTLDPLRNLNWPNLKELHFVNMERINELDVVFRNLRLPKLELLSISLDDMDIANYREWKKRGQKKAFKNIFLGLHHLSTSSPNLKTLRIDTRLLWEKNPDQRLGFPRGLPCPKNIKTLEIADNFYRDDPHRISDYSFLRRFPHVENIHVVHVYRNSMLDKDWDFDRREYQEMVACFPFDAPIRREIVKVHKLMYSGRMYESNIWELIPSLKVFSCRFCAKRSKIYTRRSYERRCLAE